MRFHWFAEVTYPHLPSNFAEQCVGAWVTPPRSLYDLALGAKAYDTYLSEYRYADQMGFDSIAVNEAHALTNAETTHRLTPRPPAR